MQCAGWAGLKLLKKCPEGCDPRFSGGIVDPSAFAVGADEPCLAKHAEVVRDGGLGKGKTFFDVTDAEGFFAPGQQTQDAQAHGMADGFECCCDCVFTPLVSDVRARVFPRVGIFGCDGDWFAGYCRCRSHLVLVFPD